MSKLSDLINPPTQNMTPDELYKLLNTIYVYIDSLTNISNMSQLTNANFATLSAQGLTPTTQADGDDFEFVDDWFVVGATQATYSIAAVAYPEDSQVKSASPYYISTEVFTYSGSGLYFYQRQLDTVRKYQNQFITFTVQASNFETELVKLRIVIDYNYGPSSELLQSNPIYLKNGYNEINVTLQTPSLRDKVVDASNYVEFRLEFSELYSGTADIDFYLIKGEFGRISTPLTN